MNDMHELKRIIRRNPTWTIRPGHRVMLLRMARRINARNQVNGGEE